jgi:hypothetical protein
MPFYHAQVGIAAFSLLMSQVIMGLCRKFLIQWITPTLARERICYLFRVIHPALGVITIIIGCVNGQLGMIYAGIPRGVDIAYWIIVVACFCFWPVAAFRAKSKKSGQRNAVNFVDDTDPNDPRAISIPLQSMNQQALDRLRHELGEGQPPPRYSWTRRPPPEYSQEPRQEPSQVPPQEPPREEQRSASIWDRLRNFSFAGRRTQTSAAEGTRDAAEGV